jgi:hypothetical protein
MPSEDTDVFVVWLERTRTAAELPSYCGQVEHIPSGARASFGTVDELLAFMGRFSRGGQQSDLPAPGLAATE